MARSWQWMSWLCAHREARTQCSYRAAATHARPSSTSALQAYLTRTRSTFGDNQNDLPDPILCLFQSMWILDNRGAYSFWVSVVWYLLVGRTSGSIAVASSSARAVAGRAVATRFKWSRHLDTTCCPQFSIPLSLCDALRLMLLTWVFSKKNSVLYLLECFNG